jgi:VanZ family protein
MNLSTIFDKRHDSVEKFYRIFFYVLCISLLITSAIKVGGEFNRIKVGIGEVKFRLDHLLHSLVYFAFSIYYLAGQYLGLRLFEKRTHVFFFSLIFMLGFLAEVLQIWVPSRSFSMMDLLANLIGIIGGLIVTLIALRQNKTR